MTCPRCQVEFEAERGECPDCGIQLLRRVSGMVTTSAVMISAGGEKGFYRSVRDVPEPLRRQLLDVTTSANSGTIVIADRGGKEQLTHVVALRDAVRGKRRKATPGVPPACAEPQPPGYSWVVWAGALLIVGSAGVIAAVFTAHW